MKELLFFTDLMGGSPFNVAASLGHGKENVRIVAGTNLPMLVEIVMSRNSWTIWTDLWSLYLRQEKSR